MKTTACLVLAAIVGSLLSLTLDAAEQQQVLWSIGVNDNDYAEFALAPNHYDQFTDDGFFAIGQSDPIQHWPYVQPGPADSWAGARTHTFSIAFGLEQIPAQGTCRLTLDFVDTQGATPPTLRVDINDRSYDRATPRGAGDASVYGDAKKGREHELSIEFPSTSLRVGNNLVSITTLTGSWVLYDYVALQTPPGAELGTPNGTAVRHVRSEPLLVDRNGQLFQTISVNVLHFGTKRDVIVHVSDAAPVSTTLEPGTSTIDIPVKPVASATELAVRITAGATQLATTSVTLTPARKWVVYLLPHSHVDIGYTHVQTDVEQSHWRYYEQAIQASRETANYPPGAQFKWNAEVLWATDSYLQQASTEKQADFIAAVKQGWMGLDALYGNELTALCRPEELIRLVDFSNQLERQHNITIDSAMISDVPGYTWGLVSVLAESGVKYFSIGPNGGHRIGYTLSEYGDKPFWWRSPDGRHRVLCWIPRTGYWRGFRGEAGLLNLLKQMDESDYPYDLVQIRHCLGDNAGPGLELSEFVKDWNARYAFPKLIIATTSEMMHALERRYGDQLPELRGDFTPYWEDGAGSSARETALNRAAAERLVQAETLYSLFQSRAYPREEFRKAWRNVVLYDEHTWGAHCSISQPESEFTKAQWAIKQKFALDADSQSKQLLHDAVSPQRSTAPTASTIDVLNTCSWPRTDVVLLPRDLRVVGDRATDERGNDVPTQRLASGELALLATDVPALGARRFTLAPGIGTKLSQGTAKVDNHTLTNDDLTVAIDSVSGAISSLQWNGHDFAATGDAQTPKLNDYYYVAGRKPDHPLPSERPEFIIEDPGPLVASLRISAQAPGCHRLERTVRLTAGIDRVDLINVVDKKNIYEQEGVHFAFPFHIPDGSIRIDIPWAVVRVESDQLPGACKNYFTAQRWADISNKNLGITLATVDAPLLEAGKITCDPVAVGWIKHLDPTQTLYSYVMNNYWETNYKAGQEGPTTFHYSLHPHHKYSQAEAQQFGMERSQPLLAVAVDPTSAPLATPVRISGEGVVATCLKPAADGNALILRLFNSSAVPTQATLDWQTPLTGTPQICDLAERPLTVASNTLPLAPYQFITVRATLRQ